MVFLKIGRGRSFPIRMLCNKRVMFISKPNKNKEGHGISLEIFNTSSGSNIFSMLGGKNWYIGVLTI